MLRSLLQKIFQKSITRFALRVSSSPRKDAVFTSLSQLVKDTRDLKTGKGVIIPFDMNSGKFIIFSDEHKGGADLADDFHLAEKNYLSALRFYDENNFNFINMGDCEELWENTPKVAIEKNRLTLFEEAKFLLKDRYYRIFGNHDLEWKYSFQQNLYLKPIFGEKLKVYEAVLLETEYNDKTFSIFLCHGHQGDQKSDGNAFSKWVVAAIWTPIQRFLEINLNSISDSFELVDKHNIMMYDWSATQQNTIFISGHTHKPVFASLDHIDRLHKQLQKAEAENNPVAIESLKSALQKRESEYAGKKVVTTMAHPSYFNSGCCCFSDGDITGIEISEGLIRLVKWHSEKGVSTRIMLEESPLFYIFDQL
ncbi:MAG: metallophosphoesterase [Chitinophagaceae bacterium]